MFVVYIIKSQKTGEYYVGQTNDLTDRLHRHNAGYEISTKAGVPWLLIHREEFTSRSDAVNREKEIKGYKGGNSFKNLIGHY